MRSHGCGLRRYRFQAVGPEEDTGAQCAILTPHGNRTVAKRVQTAMTPNIIVLQPLIALIAGILILVMPRLLNYIVAIYLIVIGLTGLSPHLLR